MSLLTITPALRMQPMPMRDRCPKPRSGAARFPGINDHARTLGVSRQHLYLVLSGKRTGTRLVQRYKAHVAKTLAKQAA